jgi:hypothetical protein
MTNKICVICKNALILYGMSSNKRPPNSDNEQSDEDSYEEYQDQEFKDFLEAKRLKDIEYSRNHFLYLKSLTECAARKRIATKSLQQKWVAEVCKKLNEIDICNMKDMLMHITEINEWLVRGNMKPFHKEKIKTMHSRSLEIEIASVEHNAYAKAKK